VRFRLLALAAMLAGAPPAVGETLVTSLSSQRVAITSNYTGAQILAFGVVERDAQTVSRNSAYDVVVTVRGPRQPVVVREKEPFGPIWINRAQQKFPNAPAFLAVHSSRPITEVSSDALRQRMRVGLQAVVNAPGFTLDRGVEDDPFRAALLRLKARERLYRENEGGVAFLTPTLFQAPIALPATAPPGDYHVEVALFADGVVLARSQSRFELVKTGFEQRVAEAAHQSPLLYGLGIAALSLAFGWIASVVFRRD
jgi:uncharacterized protein (TIGR02186 family)